MIGIARLGLAAGALFLLAGCATNAQRRSVAMEGEYKAAILASTQCAHQVNDDPRWAPLWVHAARNAAAPRIDQLADQTYASSEDVTLLEAHHDAMAPCRSAMVSQLSAVDSRLGDVVTQTFLAQETTILAVVRHQMTWGDGNLSQQKRILGLTQQMADVRQQIGAELNQENEAEIENRQRVGQAIASGLGAAAQAAHDAQPVVTTCNGGNGYASCVTSQ